MLSLGSAEDNRVAVSLRGRATLGLSDRHLLATFPASAGSYSTHCGSPGRMHHTSPV